LSLIKRLTIANPTSAFFKAGPSFVPSPVTATTSRVGFNFDAIIPLTSTYLSWGDERANTRKFGQTLSNKLCSTYTSKNQKKFYLKKKFFYFSIWC